MIAMYDLVGESRGLEVEWYLSTFQSLLSCRVVLNKCCSSVGDERIQLIGTSINDLEDMKGSECVQEKALCRERERERERERNVTMQQRTTKSKGHGLG